MNQSSNQFMLALAATVVSVVISAVVFALFTVKRARGANDTNSSFVYKSGLSIEDTKAKKSICVLLIDPQNSFCDPKGSLSVSGADQDSLKFAAAFSKHGAKVDEVIVTLDTHQRYHIAHSLFWVNNKREHPAPFTVITSENVVKGVWKAQNPQHQDWALKYVRQLEGGGRFQLIIWPDHCLVGSTGHAVYEPLMNELLKWEDKKHAAVTYVLKGNNALTEHYSAIKAEVCVDEDPNTHVNTVLIERLRKFDRIVVAGQALSHCVNFTVRDLVEHLSPEERTKVYVARDACSSVTGFEKAGETFIIDMKKAGVKVVKIAEAFS